MKSRESIAQPPPDAAQRARVLDPGGSFIVQAPAGSGKTELLIQRYLALLGSVESPEEIVAITFTRKAAAEMRERVLQALEARKDPLAQNPARLRIQTIDSLALSLTRQMPVLSRFGAQPQNVEDAGELYAAAARATLALVEDSGSVAAHIERLLEHLDNDAGRVEGLLAGMLARRDHWIRHLARMRRGELQAALLAGLPQAPSSYDPFRIRCADIIKQMILTTGELAKPIHRVLNNGRADFVIRVDRLARLEVHIGVLSRAPHHRVIG